jgi:hypothetical protein
MSQKIDRNKLNQWYDEAKRLRDKELKETRKFLEENWEDRIVSDCHGAGVVGRNNPHDEVGTTFTCQRCGKQCNPIGIKVLRSKK